MKTRTFTVKIVESYEHDDPTDEAAVGELRDALQSAYDEGLMIGDNFLIVEVEDGNADFWREWNRRVSEERLAARQATAWAAGPTNVVSV